jgi:flagellar hook-associated protein 3 FlgL
MRVTYNGYSSSLINQINTLVSRQTTLQNQVTTEQRITNPGDDPAAFARVMSNDAEAKACTQYKNNITLLQQQATASASVISSLKTICSRASEIATQADGTQSAKDLQDYATEVSQLIQQAVQVANTQYNGEYVMGGTATSQAPFQMTTNSQGIVQQVTYSGNAEQKSVEIDDGVTVSVTPPGVNATTSGARGLLMDGNSGADFFQHLIDLQNNLQSGNAGSISKTDSVNLGKDEDNILYHLSTNSALQSRLEAGSSIMTSRVNSLTSAISGDSDVEITTAITKLSQAQTAYNAALQTGAKLLSTSLLDYLQ